MVSNMRSAIGRRNTRWNASAIPAQSGRIAIVTGSNTGVGLETARELARAGATVVLACRNTDKADAALADVRSSVADANVLAMRLDLADLDSVQKFVRQFESRFCRLDLLVNNAGVMMPPKSLTKQGFELQFGVNYLGHFALTGLLLPLMFATPGARVVNVSSQAHRQGAIDFDDIDWKIRPYRKGASYGASKLAILLFTFELQRRLDAAGVDVTVAAAHPGWTGTDLSRHFGVIRYLFRFLTPFLGMWPPQGALPTLRAATDIEVQTGDYFGPHGLGEMRGYPERVGTTKAARDPEAAARLWNVSVARTGVDIDAALIQLRQSTGSNPNAAPHDHG